MIPPEQVNHNVLMAQLRSLRENDQMPRPSEVDARIKLIEARDAKARRAQASFYAGRMDGPGYNSADYGGVAYAEQFGW